MILLARFIEGFVASTTASYSVYVLGFQLFITICSAFYAIYFVSFFRRQRIPDEFVERTVIALENN